MACSNTDTCNLTGGVIFNLENVQDYYPYGKTLRKFTASQGQERFLTTQHERDEETGLDYRGARFYDADIARFLSLDPLAADFATWSPYNYVVGNPLTFIDPSGRAPEGWSKDNIDLANRFGLFGGGPSSTNLGDWAAFQTEKINVALVPTQSDKAGIYDQDYKLFNSSNIKTLRVSSASDAVTQLAGIVAEGKEIQNLIIVSHGSKETAWFQIGGQNYLTPEGTKKASNLGKLGEMVSKSGAIILLACHCGSEMNGGEALSLAVAQATNRTVFSSRSWTRSTSNFNILGWVNQTSQGSNAEEGRSRYEDYALKNVGSWIMVKPEGNIKELSNFMISKNGSIFYFNNTPTVRPYPNLEIPKW